MSADTPIIYVVDDDPDILETTQKLLSSNDWDVVCLSHASNFLDVYHPEQPGCLVLDVQMPEMSGLELQRTLTDWNMDIPIIFIAGDSSVEHTVAALKAGAQDFIEKPFTRETLIRAVEAALMAQAAQRKEKQLVEAASERFRDLTDREWEVLSLMVSGPNILSSKEVARELDISHRTVEHHRARIKQKTQCPSLAELVRLAFFIGIANPDFPGSAKR